MYLVRLFLALVTILSIFVLGNMMDHQFRVAAQNNETLYQVMLTADLAGFIATGGDPVGYRNYFKWSYATWRKSPERTWWQKALFWNAGFLYDASNPPQQYQYVPHLPTKRKTIPPLGWITIIVGGLTVWIGWKIRTELLPLPSRKKGKQDNDWG